MIEAVIFDIDGTIVDSVDLHARAVATNIREVRKKHRFGGHTYSDRQRGRSIDAGVSLSKNSNILATEWTLIEANFSSKISSESKGISEGTSVVRAAQAR